MLMPEGINKIEGKIPYDEEKLKNALLVANSIDDVCAELQQYSSIVFSSGPMNTEDVINLIRETYEKVMSGRLPTKDLIELYRYVNEKIELSQTNEFAKITRSGSLRMTVAEIIIDELSNFNEEVSQKLLYGVSDINELREVLKIFNNIPVGGHEISGERYIVDLNIKYIEIEQLLSEFDSVWHGQRKTPLVKDKLEQLLAKIKEITKDVVEVGGIREAFEDIVTNLIYKPGDDMENK